MSKTRDDFRWDIGRVAYDAMDQTTGGGWAGERPYGVDRLRDSEMRDVAEAVAAQVIRDVYEATYGTENPRAGAAFRRLLDIFAADRGIDLEKGE